MSSTNNPDVTISLAVDDQGIDLADPERSKMLLEQLRSGYAPSTVEAGEVRRSIAQSRTYQNLLDGEISSLEHQLTTKRAEREAIGKVVSFRSALVSPVRHLPRELLLEIFDQACPSNAIPPGPRRTKIDDCPSMVVSHVCHFWRELAFSSPKLWSRIRINLTLKDSDDYRYEHWSKGSKTKESILVEMYLVLSKDHPLDITILKLDDDEYIWTEIGDFIERDKRTLSLLADNAWRWRSFICYNNALPAVPEPSGDIPLLRDVKISYARRSTGEDSPPEPSWLTRARNTENLTIFNPSYPLVPFTWNGIKHLIIICDSNSTSNFNTLSTIHSFLGHLSLASPNLKELNWLISTNVENPVNPSSFDHLTCLRVGGNVNLDWIIAPNLQHLDVSELAQKIWTPKVVTGFIQTSGANLTSLTLDTEYLRYEIFLFAFKGMKSLAHLIVTNVQQSNSRPLFANLTVLSGIDAADSENVLLPQLKTVTLYWDSILNVFHLYGSTSRTEAVVVIDKLIIGFLESRRSQQPLNFVRFSVLTFGDLEESCLIFKCQNSSIKERLRQLQSVGLSLCFNGDWSPIEELACVTE